MAFTKAQLEALKNTLLASNQPILASQHRQQVQGIIDEMYDAQSRANILVGVQSDTVQGGSDTFLVFRSGQAYQLPVSLVNANDLASLGDVFINNLEDGDSLVYDAVADRWENRSILLGFALSNLIDVELTSLAGGDILRYDSGDDLWKNVSLASLLAPYALLTDLNDYQLLSEKGEANGYASLDSGGKVPLSQINDAILGQVSYQGTWNADTNTPTLANPPASTTKGDYYVVSVGGSFAGLDFEVGDWIISNGTEWEKVNNTDAVRTVFGRLGDVVANAGDYAAFYLSEVNLDYTPSPTNGIITNSGGDNATIPMADSTNAGLFSSAEKTKLDGISTGANNYIHPTGFTNQPATALTGASVISRVLVNNEGHVTGVDTRGLTAANIGAEPSFAAGTTAQYFRGDKTFQTLNTGVVPESGNLYFTDARARDSLSFVAGSADYNSTTGVITIPTNNNQITNGAGYITSTVTADPDSVVLNLRGGLTDDFSNILFLNNVGFTIQNYIQSSPSSLGINSQGNTPITFGTNLSGGGGTRMTISGAGAATFSSSVTATRVSINTSSTSFTPLFLNANGNYASSGNMTSGFAISDGTTGRALNMGVFESGGYAWIQGAYVNNADTTFPLLLQPNGGNVGIGTDSPRGRMSVEQNGSSPSIVNGSNGCVRNHVFNFSNIAQNSKIRFTNNSSASGRKSALIVVKVIGFQDNTNNTNNYTYGFFSFLYIGRAGADSGSLIGLETITSVNFNPLTQVTLNSPVNGVWSFDINQSIASSSNKYTVYIESITSDNNSFEMSDTFDTSIV